MQPEPEGPADVPVNISLKGVKSVQGRTKFRELQLKVQLAQLLRVVLVNQRTRGTSNQATLTLC